MLDLFMSGFISRRTKLCTDKNNKPFALAKIRVLQHDKSLIVNLITFRNSVIEKIIDLKEGDPISVSGPANVYIAKNAHKENFIRIDITASKIY